MDRLTREARSRLMSHVHSKNTLLEMRVRRLLHGCGYRYRLHCTWLPGKPDLVFVRRRKIIFIHGCFWHKHPNCTKAKYPTSKTSFWVPKLRRNRRRDLQNVRFLRKAGWDVEIVWQCETKDMHALEERLRTFLA